MKKVLYPELVGEMAKRGDTQEKLGEILGLTRASVLNKLAGKTEWTINEIDTICKHYKKDYYELFKKNEYELVRQKNYR